MNNGGYMFYNFSNSNSYNYSSPNKLKMSGKQAPKNVLNQFLQTQEMVKIPPQY